MTLLTVNYSEALAALVREGFEGFDGLEIGPWFTPDQIRGFRQQFPGMPFYFHASNLMPRPGFNRNSPQRLKAYLACTQSPWLSFHIELLPDHIFRLSEHLGVRLPPPAAAKCTRRFLDRLAYIRKLAGLPLVLENLHSIPGEQYHYAASPEIITKIVHQADCGFLLDLAHARVAAELQNQDVQRYIERLPLDRLVQIHVSGVREKNGRLVDAHEAMQEEDYQLLAWVLGGSRPQVVTLEYIRKKEELRKQLVRLWSMVAGY